LANGLSYYLVKNQAQPGRADFYLVEKSGTALEESGQAGMTAFLAQMSMREPETSRD
jgi:predicted Zn-dependent peptidase